jgi:cytochrome c oxidase subunit 2
MTLFSVASLELLVNIVSNDAPHYFQYGIQPSGAPILTSMISFHHYLVAILLVVGGCTFYLLWHICTKFDAYNAKPEDFVKFSHSNELEIGWTVIPAIILLFLAVPSFSLLYSLDESINPSLTLKVVGHQWYWSYEYSDFWSQFNCESLSFDSYMIEDDEVIKGRFRTLEVDNRVVIPTRVHIRVLVTSADVLHSWAVPSLGVKIDACPGRLSQVSLYAQRKAMYFGQCSEICGINHGFMPIVLMAVPRTKFYRWLSKRYAGVGFA